MEKLFQKLGFDGKESSIYISCLKKELNTPASLARITGIKRGTVYFYLEKLKEKGLLTYKVKGKRKYIVAEQPQRAFQEYLANENEKLSRQEQVIASLTPQLQAVMKQKNASTNVQFHEGVAGVRLMIDKIIEAKTNIYWFGSIDMLLSLVGEEELYRRLTLRRLKQGTTSYAITDRRILAKKRFGEKIGNFRQFRFLEKNFTIDAGMLLFGNVVALASKDHPVKIALIEDSLMAQTLHYFFMLLWGTLPDK
ncbi:MAG: helix-turn-helix domain-containing protein [Parcubacteria group bacterium]